MRIARLHKLYMDGGIEALLTEFTHTDYGVFTLGEIGEILGITREQVRQIESTALKKLKHPKVGLKLKQYADDMGVDDNTRFFGKGESIR